MLLHVRLKDVLDYDPETGVWTWLQGWYAGKRAGTTGKKGYRQIWVDGKQFLSARLAWFYMTGEWPSALVDHKKPGFEYRSDDRWANLRLATHGQNGANRLSANSMLKGVQRRPSGKFTARIGGQARIYLGTHDSAEGAHAAYLVKAREVYGEFAQGDAL